MVHRYVKLNDLVDQIFPPLTKPMNTNYTDFAFWRTPIPSVVFDEDTEDLEKGRVEMDVGEDDEDEDEYDEDEDESATSDVELPHWTVGVAPKSPNKDVSYHF